MSLKSDTPVNALKRELKQCVADGEPISVEDVERVNRFSRIERMRQETRMLIASLVNPTEDLRAEIDVYEHLAVDWVYSGELDWHDSMAARQAARIIEMNNAAQEAACES